MRETRRAGQRFHTVGDGVETWHSFSYGAHYDPEQIRFGAVMAVNTEHVAPGRGYDHHDHADVEIVTWVLQGALRHEDSTGHGGIVRPGTAQRLSAGTGVQHSERNASDTEPLVFVQMMLVSDRDGAPEYVQVDVPDGEGLVPAVEVHADAELGVARIGAGGSVVIPEAERVLVIVTRGVIEVDGERLGVGDELRTAGERLEISADGSAEALVWRMG